MDRQHHIDVELSFSRARLIRSLKKWTNSSILFLLVNFQAELYIGDQNGILHVWDLKTDNNIQLVSFFDVNIFKRALVGFVVPSSGAYEPCDFLYMHIFIYKLYILKPEPC